MSIKRKAKRCVSSIIDDFLIPTQRLQRQLLKMVSSNKLVIKQEKIHITPTMFRFSNRFVPLEIHNYIMKNINTLESIRVVEGSTIFIVNLYTSLNNLNSNLNSNHCQEYNSYKNRRNRIIEAVSITIGMSEWSLCGMEHSKVVINLFDVDIPKVFLMDGSPITPNQVNTAYTTPCRYVNDDGEGRKLEVMLFRREEWEKVLFHELMHLYSYDIASNDKRINTRLSHIFRVKCDFNLTEAYAEFWARTLWVIWKTSGANKQFEVEMEKQCLWSIKQGIMVLINMGLENVVLESCDDRLANVIDNDDDLHGNRKNKMIKTSLAVCKETTASFSYYVICGLMMTDWECVMAWCYDNNDFPLLFTGGFHNVSSFITLLRELACEEYILDEWKDQLQKMSSNLQGIPVTARMTM